MHRWYQMIFLSQHSMCPKLSHVTVAKVIKCDVTQRYSIDSNRSDSTRSAQA